MSEVQEVLSYFQQGKSSDEISMILNKNPEMLLNLFEVVSKAISMPNEIDKLGSTEKVNTGNNSYTIISEAEAKMDDPSKLQQYAQVVMQPYVIPDDRRPILSNRNTNVPLDMALAVPSESPTNLNMIISEECTNESSQIGDTTNSNDYFWCGKASNEDTEANDHLVAFCNIVNSPECHFNEELLENSVASDFSTIQSSHIDNLAKSMFDKVNEEISVSIEQTVCQNQTSAVFHDLKTKIFEFQNDLNEYSMTSPASTIYSKKMDKEIEDISDDIDSIVSTISSDAISLIDLSDFEDEYKTDLPFVGELSLVDKNTMVDSSPFHCIISTPESQMSHQITSDTLSLLYDGNALMHQNNAQICQNMVLDSTQTYDNVSTKTNRKRCFNGTSSDNDVKKLKTEIPLAANTTSQNTYDHNPVFKMDADGDLPLHVAVLNGDINNAQIILALMDHQMLDTRNMKKQTPLHLALYMINPEMVELLLKYGADPLVTDGAGNNLMHLVCENSLKVIQDILVHLMADPRKLVKIMETTNNDGHTPMHIAARKGNQEIINLLLKKIKFNINVKDMKTGSTPLVYSLQQSNWELAQTLIEHGAGINIATNSGMFPLDFVLTTNNVQLAKDLLKRQAESGVKTEYSDKDMKNLFETEMRKRRRKRPTGSKKN